jgi:riboflavin synthase
MFTGLVEAVGTIIAVRETDAGRELEVRAPFSDLAEGESSALNGACLTVRTRGVGSFTVAAVSTTLERTAIGGWREGDRVNLERAMKATDRFGGHIVQGHVDALGRVLGVERQGSALLIRIGVPPELDELLVPHGSVTVDGVSLTVNALAAPGVLEVSIIEFTERHTTLGGLTAGSMVHLEGDVIGKHVRRLVEARAARVEVPPATP